MISLITFLISFSIQSLPKNKLSVHDGPDKVFIVDIALVVLVPNQQLLGLLVAELLPQGCQQVTQFSRAYKPIPILNKIGAFIIMFHALLCFMSNLVKMSQPFNKVITSVS